MPWDLIRTLITETYGGKIDDDEDFAQLRHLVNSFMTPAAFEEGHQLVGGARSEETESNKLEDDGLKVPEGTTMAAFRQWVNQLPEREPPTYLGLPANAEKVLLVGHGQETIAQVGKVMEVLEEGERLTVETGQGS